MLHSMSLISGSDNVDESSLSPKAQKGLFESQRALELRKFYDPYQSINRPSEETLNEKLNFDHALRAYAEVTLYRLGGVHSMISILDGFTQYFIAGAKVKGYSGDNELIMDDTWFGCSDVPTKGGLCENTLAIDTSENNKYPCFVINDLSVDPRFHTLPTVDGTIASYRWYAGVPITTKNQIKIGVLFVFGDRKITGLTLEKKKFLHRQAENIMKYLETQREAVERQRVTLMSKGIATFLDKTSSYTNSIVVNSTLIPETVSEDDALAGSGNTLLSEDQDLNSTKKMQNASAAVLDQIRITLDHGADILRESLELNTGGIVFLDTTDAYAGVDVADAHMDQSTDLSIEVQKTQEIKNGNPESVSESAKSRYQNFERQLPERLFRSSTREHTSTKVLSMSAAKTATWDPEAHVLDGKTLHTLINSYPKGNVWYMDENGYFLSLEQVRALEQSARISPSGSTNHSNPFDVTKQAAEAYMLSKIFHRARQIMFLPLWDTVGERWYAASFVWSQSAVPVWTVELEIPYLSSFTNSMMVEISRLDALKSNKMKSDFISSISHEFRSPLHGILASADFLRESKLDASQIEFVSTIQSCSGTLLETINHVLDYSKINSFKNKVTPRQGSFSSELHQITDIALLCENTINDMIAANHFKHAPTTVLALPNDRDALYTKARAPLQIILDFEKRDWIYKVHAGAIQRILMNIFGNSQKYTEGGYIIVQLLLQTELSEDSAKLPNHSGECFIMRVKDSGRGMSEQYIERRLYHPFAQEDNFSPGVGLGLFIVWSIVNQLGGKIDVRSKLGTGTDIEVTLPVEKSVLPDIGAMHNDLTNTSLAAKEIMGDLQSRATAMTFSLDRSQTMLAENACWDSIQKYCSEWYGFNLDKSNNKDRVDLHLANETTLSASSFSSNSDSQHGRTLVIHRNTGAPYGRGRHHSPFTAHMGQPIGPYRLARIILSLLDQHPTSNEPQKKDGWTQTPIASPEEYRGMVDYEFKTECQNTYHTAAKEMQQKDTPQPKIAEGFAEKIARMEILTPQEPPCRMGNSTSKRAVIESHPLTIEPSRVVSATATPLRILCVDDNSLNLQLIHRYLQKRKDDIIVDAMNGLEAVNAVKIGEAFDVVFMDISMPVMDGFEATRMIRGWESQTSSGAAAYKAPNYRAYIVAMTGLGSQKARDEAVSSGFDDFMTKPVKLPKVGALLQRLSSEKAARLLLDSPDA